MANDPKILFATRANTLRVAAEDIQAFAATPWCAVNMRYWNTVGRGGCHACQAGAVAIQSLGMPFDVNIFDGTPDWIQEIFRLLDHMRQGSPSLFIYGEDIKIWPTITAGKCMKVLVMYGIERKTNSAYYDLCKWLRQDYVPYEESPQKYVDWLHTVANVLDDLEK